MAMPTQRIRIVAGTPLEVGDRRLLPSVLVSTVEGGDVESTLLRLVKMRPVSVVEQSSEGARWIEIPNATMDSLSMMAAVGFGLAGVCWAIILLIRLVRGH